MGFGMALSKINLYERKNTPLNEENIITLDGKNKLLTIKNRHCHFR